MENKEFTEEVVTIEEEILEEEELYAHLDEVETLEEALVYMEAIIDLADISDNHRIFPKIEECINIAGRQEKSLEIRKYIMEEVVDCLFPLLNSHEKSGERIQVDRLTELANFIGDIITSHDLDDDFKIQCSKAFVEVITLK